MFFSVLISLYDRDNPLFFREAIKSIYDKQTLKPNEIILVVDGQINNNLELELKNLEYIKNLRIYRLPKNIGLGNALNYGLKKCSNEIVARMDSDDISTNERFEVQLDFLKKNPHISVLGSNIQEFDENAPDEFIRKVPVFNDKIIKRSFYRNPMNHMSVMFKKSDVLEVGGYKHMLYYEDYYLWLRMMKENMKFHNIDRVLIRVRAGKDMLKRRQGFKMFFHELNFFKKIINEKLLPFFPSLFFFFLRCIIRLINIKLFKHFYQKFLRSKP